MLHAITLHPPHDFFPDENARIEEGLKVTTYIFLSLADWDLSGIKCS